MSHPHNPHNNTHPAWPEERLAALLRRGLGCANRAQALQALRHLDGQLFQEYCTLLAKPGATGFRPLSGVSFEAALQLYRFDAALRVLLFDAIQTIEMSLRAQWANAPAAAHGPLFYTSPALFRGDFRRRIGKGWSRWSHGEALEKLGQDYQRQQEIWGRLSAARPSAPSAQEMAGVMSFGQLSRWLIHLRRQEEREGIARTYGLHEAVLCRFLPGLVAVRNICAHHDLLYGGSFGSHYMEDPEESAVLRESCAGGGDGTLYPVATFMAFLLLQIGREDHRKLVAGLRELFGRYKSANPRHLGFPGDWGRRPVWKP